MTVRRLLATSLTAGALSGGISVALYAVALPTSADDEIHVCVGTSNDPSGTYGDGACVGISTGDVNGDILPPKILSTR